MDKPLYALHSDLEMIAIEVQTLSRSLNKLDWIMQRIKRLDDELTCQGEQMKRIEEWMYGTDTKMQNMDTKMQNMDTKMQNMDTKMQNMDTKMQNMDTKMQGMEKLITLICKKLKIKIPK